MEFYCALGADTLTIAFVGNSDHQHKKKKKKKKKNTGY